MSSGSEIIELMTSRAGIGSASRASASYSEIVMSSLRKLSACAGKLSATSWIKKSRLLLNLMVFSGNLIADIRC